MFPGCLAYRDLACMSLTADAADAATVLAPCARSSWVKYRSGFLRRDLSIASEFARLTLTSSALASLSSSASLCFSASSLFSSALFLAASALASSARIFFCSVQPALSSLFF